VVGATDPDFGEQTAQAGANACLQQLITTIDDNFHEAVIRFANWRNPGRSFTWGEHRDYHCAYSALTSSGRDFTSGEWISSGLASRPDGRLCGTNERQTHSLVVLFPVSGS
jgi:hypothetical protein